MTRAALGLVCVALAAGCGDDAPPDPLTPGPDRGAGLTDVAADLDAVLEHGALPDACAAARAQPSDRRLHLLCGKSMFFYEGFGGSGMPTALVQLLLDHFAAEVGPGFSAFGLVADPSSPQHWPLGLAPTTPVAAGVDALAFTCASCHFARLPDGRYAVGAPNHAYAYGRHTLALALFPQVALGGPGAHDPEALATIQPLVDHYRADPSLAATLLGTLLPLAGAPMPQFPAADEQHYARWRSGTMDFLIAPLPLDDGVHTVSKIPPLWELPDDDEERRSGMASAMLGWTGATRSLMRFAEGFVAFGGGSAAEWPDERLQPLVDYVLSLRRPANPTPPDAAMVARGRALFATGCASCHGGPRGSGLRVYDFAEMGTDAALARWLDPDGSGRACCGAPMPADEPMTHGVHAPRLVGSWAQSRFLHDGALDSLEQLLCLAPRPGVTEPAFGDGGHTYGCMLAEADRRALVAYLQAR